MNRLITAKDIADRDSQPTVREWIRVTSIQLRIKNPSLVTFDGDVRGASVYALVSNGRLVAMCNEPGCNGCEYVYPKEPFFFCLSCSNGRSGKARSVKFPKDLNEIEAALLERDMIPVGGRNAIEQAFNARPANPNLRRDWAPQEIEGHPGIVGRVIVDEFGETSIMIRNKNTEINNASNV